jgi:hypothetical protein
MLNALALYPRSAGSNSAEGNGLVVANKIHKHVCIGGKVKPSVACRKLTYSLL